MTTLADLKAIAIEIKNATAIGSNTAAKVGALVEAIIDASILHNSSIELLNNDVFSTPISIDIATNDELLLDKSHRYAAISAVDAHTKLVLKANADIGMTHTIVNIGQVDLDIVPSDPDDTINQTDNDKYVLAKGLCVTVKKFGNKNWFVIGT